MEEEASLVSSDRKYSISASLPSNKPSLHGEIAAERRSRITSRTTNFMALQLLFQSANCLALM